jgi:ectoine hydroxylase-related dioxygenase (phytanoyl-CoA dioxygenase family)
MYTLPHQVEFLSDAWLEEARAFLERETATRKEQLGGKPFSLSERFTDAPPHLKCPKDVAAWSMRYDGEKVSVSRKFDAKADMVVEGDYQAGLMAAQFVGVLAPGGMDEMWREVRHLFGKDAVRTRGALADPVQGQLLGLLHDHMARRTVENPDLAHRAERLGLTANIREMEEQGYTVVERAISPQFADEMRAAILRELRLMEAPAMMWSLYHGREFERLAVNPKLMTLIDASLGRGAVIASLASTVRGPGKGGIGLHTDYAHVPEPYPEFAMTGVGVWSFEDWTESCGPTWIIPGSHKWRRGPRAGERPNGGVPIEMPKGSVVFFTHGVWHWQGDRTDPGERVALHAHFNRGILRSLEPKRTDPQLLHRNPPRLGEMLGEDDMFDKMSAQGRDYLRGRHMGELLAFTDKQKKKILEPAG